MRRDADRPGELALTSRPRQLSSTRKTNNLATLSIGLMALLLALSFACTEAESPPPTPTAVDTATATPEPTSTPCRHNTNARPAGAATERTRSRPTLRQAPRRSKASKRCGTPSLRRSICSCSAATRHAPTTAAAAITAAAAHPHSRDSTRRTSCTAFSASFPSEEQRNVEQAPSTT